MLNKILNNIFITILNILAPLIVIPILTSNLGLDIYGRYSTIIAFITLVTVFSDFGFGMYIPKQLVKRKENKNIISKIIWQYLIVKVPIVFIFCFISYFILDISSYLFVIVCFLILFQCLNLEVIFIGLEYYSVLSKIQIISKVSLVICVLLFNFNSYGLEKALLLQVISFSILFFCCIIVLVRNQYLKSINIDFKILCILLKNSIPFFLSNVLSNAYQKSSTYFVSLFLNDAAVAIYAIGIQLYKVGQSVISAVSVVLYTTLNKNNNIQLVKKITIVSFLIMLLFLPFIVIWGKLILSMLLSFNIDSLYYFALIMYISLFFCMISSYWGYPVLTAIGKDKYAHLSVLMSAIYYFLCFCIILLLNKNNIYSFGFCILLSEFFGSITRLCFYKK